MTRTLHEDGSRRDSTEPVVSVSITTYNHAPYIRQAVESVLDQQTTFPIEIIIGDDCSTDGTRDILHDLSRANPGRLQLVLPDCNLGGGGVPMFLRTLENVRGRYIAAFDGDDYWTNPYKLQRQADYLDANPACSMYVHDALEVYVDGSRPPTRMNPQPPEQPIKVESLLQSCFIPACSPMFRRKIIDPVPPWMHEMPIGDIPLYVLALEHGRIEYLDEVMGVWRMHGRGTWSGLDVLGRHHQFIDARHRINAGTGGRYAPAIGRIVHAAHFRLAIEYSRLGMLPEARKFAWKVLRERPQDSTADMGKLVREVLGGHMRTLTRGRALLA